MGYECIVCVKQVPDTANVTGEAMKADGTVNRGALPAVFNPDDLHALEAALEVRDRFGGNVTAITMGPLGACEVLRECMYRGADRAILVTDRRAAASDTLATSYILSKAIEKIGKYDFIFCGRQAIDGDTAQVGPQAAEKLKIAQVTYFENLISLEGSKAVVTRNVGNGWEKLEADLPLLITVLDTANVTRAAIAQQIMRCKRARVKSEVEREVDAEMRGQQDNLRIDEVNQRMNWLQKHGLVIEQWDLDDIQADLQWCGLAGSPTKVHRVQSIVLTMEGYTEVEPNENGIAHMIEELIVDHTLG